MDQLHEPKSEALRALYWRDEILQLMFWIKGEGLGERVDPELLDRFLGVQTTVGIRYLDRLVDEGLLDRDPDGRYGLTEQGHQHGARVFAHEFADLTQPGHGECGPDCWCHMSVAEAEACLDGRSGTGERGAGG
ncbi:hypothetical protein SAMN05216266_120101 [Amycolatopsis marina]|uniref:Uncharacterized protein n=2 Tax=Amycolatopsis marina TaxID=490629 RepID=A0A1I1C330_9PSEU|nr:hypothetical protein SAMN05216266_120101 [Amycolatopsis marina]